MLCSKKSMHQQDRSHTKFNIIDVQIYIFKKTEFTFQPMNDHISCILYQIICATNLTTVYISRFQSHGCSGFPLSTTSLDRRCPTTSPWLSWSIRGRRCFTGFSGFGLRLRILFGFAAFGRLFTIFGTLRFFLRLVWLALPFFLPLPACANRKGADC